MWMVGAYAEAETWGVDRGTTGVGSETTGASGFAVSVVVGSASSVAAGFSLAFSAFGEVLPLTVARSLANGDFGFSVSSSLVVAFSFLLNHGRELLRLSVLTTGVSVALVSPLVTGASVVSVGITGAVSLTGSVSLAGTAGAASVSGFFSLC